MAELIEYAQMSANVYKVANEDNAIGYSGTDHEYPSACLSGLPW
jgi:hypothetical protein